MAGGWVCRVEISRDVPAGGPFDQRTTLSAHRADSVTAALTAMTMVLQMLAPDLRRQFTDINALSEALGNGPLLQEREREPPAEDPGSAAPDEACAQLRHIIEYLRRHYPSGQVDAAVTSLADPAAAPFGSVHNAMVTTLAEQQRRQHRLVHGLKAAMLHVGLDRLEPMPGRPWFDALTDVAPQVAQDLAAMANSQQQGQT